MADDPSVYGSFMNFFLPQSARIGPEAMKATPGLFDMLGGVGLGGSSQPDTPEQQQRKKQQQNLAMAQMGMKMLQQQPGQPVPQMPQNAPQPPPGLPPATQVMPDTVYGGQGGYPSSGLQGGGGYSRRPMPSAPAYPFGRYQFVR